ncbi:MAG: hypothetical protein ABIU29_13190 [Chthoniobacterales bacterium]
MALSATGAFAAAEGIDNAASNLRAPRRTGLSRRLVLRPPLAAGLTTVLFGLENPSLPDLYS